MPGQLISVNVAHVIAHPAVRVAGHVHPSSKPATSGIDKRPASGGVWLHELGVDGDTICDQVNHGGIDQAVYAYAAEDCQWWQRELGSDLSFSLGSGSFGENLSTAGVDLTNAVIGQRWWIGSAELEVSAPRIPCATFAGFWTVPQLVKRFTAAARPGAYLRVCTPGLVQAGDKIRVGPAPAHGLTIGETFRAKTGDRSLLPKLLEAPQLPVAIRELAVKLLSG